MILAIDTATRTTAGAVLSGDDCVGQFALEARNPGDVLAAQIGRMFDESGVSRSAVEQVFVGVGPGPFTSTRVGIAVARSIGLGLGIDVLGVCTHDAIAAEFTAAEPSTEEVVVATDARRSEIYWALYHDGVRVLGPSVGAPEVVAAEYAAAVWVGNGLDRYPALAEAVARRVDAAPSATWIGRVGRSARENGVAPATGLALTDHDAPSLSSQYVGCALFEPRPLYLRRPDAVPAASR